MEKVTELFERKFSLIINKPQHHLILLQRFVLGLFFYFAIINLSGFQLQAQEHRLVINEIMYDPLTGQPEWIELFNPGSENVNLCKWQISDSNTDRRILITDKDSFVFPSGYVVISQDSSIVRLFSPFSGTLFVPGKFPRLNNDSDSVVLFDSSGSVVDSVDYQSKWGGGDGFSLERINPQSFSNNSSNWSQCVSVEGGTPGRKNSVFVSSLPSQAMVSVSPNPFSPDGDGIEDVAAISYTLPTKTSAVNLRIYDLHGRCIKSLLGASPSGSRGSIIWDGRDEAGRICQMGIYIVYIESLNSGAGKVASAKTTVVLGRKL